MLKVLLLCNNQALIKVEFRARLPLAVGDTLIMNVMIRAVWYIKLNME